MCTITEKIDGTNGVIFIKPQDDLAYADFPDFATGSRNRWITPDDDNHGFAKWAHGHSTILTSLLGPGWHYGEWWGKGINSRYGNLAPNKRFALFNTHRWSPIADHFNELPVMVVPIIRQGIFESGLVLEAMSFLRANGSVAAPGCLNPEGVMIYHHAANQYFKKTLIDDESPKGKET
jgi:hypothetical protein